MGEKQENEKRGRCFFQFGSLGLRARFVRALSQYHYHASNINKTDKTSQ